jgi:hypothetical protein
MDFERSDILKPILDNLAANDQALLRATQQRILGEFSARGTAVSTMAVSSIAGAFRELLTKRRDDLLSEMIRVLDGAPVEDFEQFKESLNADLSPRLETFSDLAKSEFLNSTQMIRSRLGNSGLLINGIPEHLSLLKTKLLAEIGLFCVKLHDSQKPRLFLKAGEVFAGNRAARKIFTAAKQSLEIIDTYFGPEVFDMLEVTDQAVKIKLISDKAKPPTKQAYCLFNQQFGQKVQFRVCDSKDIHDRFIIVDGRSALHLGASIKDLGKSDSLIDSALLDPHKQRFEELWLKATLVT